ncbi:MAG: hypothetical protein GW892_15385 [Armatimonadetes bacterium]|nr:hypothetical protein [Armatimonadota bacterium]NCO95712.1 hypothetical protein [Armatimonadota bacterium]NCP33997.1 hypothetical protein [Armatimonadota bacterium]NCQ29548.1 hypothetical protein [Armatimonadota bacterium]
MRTRICMGAVIGVALLSGWIVALVFRGRSGRDGEMATRRPSLAGLRSTRMPDRDNAYMQLVRQRAGVVTALIGLADSTGCPEGFSSTRELAVMLLGDIRATEATPVLIKHIAFRPQRVRFDPSPLGEYPCAEALVKIGEPAVQELLRDYSETPRKGTLALHVLVTQMVEGDQEIGALRIRKALKDAVGGRKQYLEALLKLYEKTPFPGAYTWQ